MTLSTTLYESYDLNEGNSVFIGNEHTSSKFEGGHGLNIEKEFKNTFSAKDYLNEYYTELSDENLYLMDWYSEVYAKMHFKGEEKLLEVGGGPTIYQLISAAAKVREITFTDYVEGNLEAVRDWIGQKDNFWDKFLEYALEKEGKVVSPETVAERKSGIVEVVKQIEQLDAAELRPEYLREFNIVQSNFCLESSTDDVQTYKKMLRHLSYYAKRGGKLLMSALEGAVAYKVGQKYFPAVFLDENIATKYLEEAGFKVENVKTVLADDPENSKYRGFLFIEARCR
ncbi:MAG: guanitoxin biosynthesis pre-guanitoxin forming N-methyltransferase GntF [Candidatus Altimarinota bacterium]